MRDRLCRKHDVLAEETLRAGAGENVEGEETVVVVRLVPLCFVYEAILTVRRVRPPLCAVDGLVREQLGQFTGGPLIEKIFQNEKSWAGSGQSLAAANKRVVGVMLRLDPSAQDFAVHFPIWFH